MTVDAEPVPIIPRVASDVDAYTTAQVDAIVEAIELTPGPQGPVGPTGATGATGPQGPAGVVSAAGTAPLTLTYNAGTQQLTGSVAPAVAGTSAGTLSGADKASIDAMPTLAAHPGLLAGYAYAAWNWTPGSNTTAIATGTLMAVPIYVPTSITIKQIGITQASNGATGTVHRIGLYSNNNGVPGNLQADGGPMAADTGNLADKFATINCAVSRGWYWIATTTNSGGNFYCYTGCVGGIYPINNNGRIGYIQAAAQSPTVALPSVFGAGALGYSSIPIPQMKFIV